MNLVKNIAKDRSLVEMRRPSLISQINREKQTNSHEKWVIDLIFLEKT
jgi:hypothetical protein